MNNKLYSTITLFTLLFVFSTRINAQEMPKEEQVEKPVVYLGVGLGFNDYGLGGIIEVPIVDRFSLYGNVGVGGWGRKVGLGLSFYPSTDRYKSSFSLGYASAFGAQGFETDMSVEPNGDMEKVKMDLNYVGTVNFVYSYNFHLGKKSKFVLSAGYAQQVTKDAFELKSTQYELDEVSERAIEILKPGGLILGFKFLFGIN